MSSFIALYRGNSVTDAKMVAVTADPNIVSSFAARLLDTPPPGAEDPVIECIEQGRRAALRLISGQEGNDAA